jgi:hypothetical protein
MALDLPQFPGRQQAFLRGSELFDHDRCGKELAQRVRDVERAVVAIAGEPARLHRTHNGRECRFRGVDREKVHRRLTGEGVEFLGLLGDALESLLR